ncbi:TetR/AcrR family transcriptional regulator [candidate division WOR-3 bacterium]|nr:TetR/AcrR family transcriptional regulator [candidate division WOR-3 bacterium]
MMHNKHSMNRKQREIEHRRETMLKAAKDLFLKKGYDAVSLAEIAEKAEFSRITIYSYFKGKTDILVAIIAETFLEGIQKYSLMVKDIESPYDKLKAYGIHEYKTFRQYPDYHLLIVRFRQYRLEKENISDRNLKALAKSDEIASNLFSEIINEGIGKGEFRDDLDIELSRHFFAKAVFAIVHSYVFRTTKDLSKLEIELDYLLRAFIP